MLKPLTHIGTFFYAYTKDYNLNVLFCFFFWSFRNFLTKVCPLNC